MLAYRFDLNKADTLRAIEMYFNHVMDNNNNQYFFLCVWNDNVGTPVDTVYTHLTVPLYSDKLNKFYTYHTPAIPVSGTIYIGWIQTESGSLSIGFDRYNDHSNRILYNTSGKWYNSSYTGSLMIRPVVGKPIPLGVPEPVKNEENLTVYPNPCTSGKIHFRLDAGQETLISDLKISITDLPGQTLLTGRFTGELDVSALQPGLYILLLSDDGGNRIITRKLIISH